MAGLTEASPLLLSAPLRARQSGRRGAVPGQLRLDRGANGNLLFCDRFLRSADNKIFLRVIGNFQWELGPPGGSM